MGFNSGFKGLTAPGVTHLGTS